MEYYNFDNEKEAPTTPPPSRRIDEEVPTVTKDTTARELMQITRRNNAVWDSMKYKAVPIQGRIILDDKGMIVDNPQEIEQFTHRDEELFLNNQWKKPIYDRHGNNITGRHATMFDTLPPTRPQKGTKRRINGGRKKRTTKHKKKNK